MDRFFALAFRRALLLVDPNDNSDENENDQNNNDDNDGDLRRPYCWGRLRRSFWGCVLVVGGSVVVVGGGGTHLQGLIEVWEQSGGSVGREGRGTAAAVGKIRKGKRAKKMLNGFEACKQFKKVNTAVGMKVE